ncbi:hypothetical protein M5K25_023589 [Dendrobium thyrsiflorum]|uniref:Uncharacterized protein n=1 Tax=Dendrobium thyrsiflorum TaxID=117978 RepID=A0ABD0UFJ9_DENTH
MPRSQMLDASGIRDPSENILAYAGELLPSLGEELHDSAVLVHEEHIC